MGTLSLVQKQITSVEAMRSLYLLGFFVLFASLQPSLGDCGPFFQLREGNVVGRGFKNWDNYTQYKCSWECIREKMCRSYEFSPTEKVQFERGTIANRSTRQVRGLH